MTSQDVGGDHWFTGFWPWWAALFWLAGYEIFALVTHRATLSRLVWRSVLTRPWLPWVVTTIAVVLLIHFFVRRH